MRAGNVMVGSLILISAPASADNLAEIWKRPNVELQSDKPISELEECVALAMSKEWLASTFRGPQSVYISISGVGNVYASVKLVDEGARRKIVYAARGNFADRTHAWVSRCI